MILSGKFVFISAESRTSNGKTYHNVNIEADDGKLLRVGTDEAVINSMEKYQRYDGSFDVGSFDGRMFMRLVDAWPVVK